MLVIVKDRNPANLDEDDVLGDAVVRVRPLLRRPGERQTGKISKLVDPASGASRVSVKPCHLPRRFHSLVPWRMK